MLGSDGSWSRGCLVQTYSWTFLVLGDQGFHTFQQSAVVRGTLSQKWPLRPPESGFPRRFATNEFLTCVRNPPARCGHNLKAYSHKGKGGLEASRE